MDTRPKASVGTFDIESVVGDIYRRTGTAQVLLSPWAHTRQVVIIQIHTDPITLSLLPLAVTFDPKIASEHSPFTT